jgi:hypothetical protein
MNELRMKVAEIIHKETTQSPQKFPRECDFQAADEVLECVATSIDLFLKDMWEDFSVSDEYEWACQQNACLIRKHLTSLRT